MNVLYLNTHDIGRYLSAYGAPVETPNLMSLAKDGACFTNCHCASPTCSPSRGALLTGQYPHSNGLVGLSHRGFVLNGEHHLASFLQSCGYETVISGVQHEVLLHEEQRIGYQKNLNPPEYYNTTLPECERLTIQDEMAGRNAAAYLRAREPGDKPFFLAVGFGSTHRAYPRVPEGYEYDYVQVPKALPNTPENRKDMAALHIAIQKMDGLCGDVLNALKESGEYDNTLILFTTDHGLPMPMMKCTAYDDGTGVSLLMCWPGMKRRHAVYDAMISHVDVFPTICDILGLSKPQWLQGKSFLTESGEICQPEDCVFAEINYHIAYEPVRAVRTNRYKYILHGERGYPCCTPAHVDDSDPKEGFRQAGYFQMPIPAEELYDLAIDPQERCNLADSMAYVDVLNEMRDKLAAWQIRTEDPLKTEGTVPMGNTAIASTMDSYSTKTQVILPECRKNIEALRGVLQNVIA